MKLGSNADVGGSTRASFTVWLVDDSENFRALLGALLDEEGGLHCARQFPTAEAVLEALEKDAAPDLILLDIRMPGMGGIAAVRPIKNLAPSTHVVMLTTFFDGQARRQTLQDGAKDLLLKSLHVEAIAERVREICSHPERFPPVDEREMVHCQPASVLDHVTPQATHERFTRPELGTHLPMGGQEKFESGAPGRLVRGMNYLRTWVQWRGANRQIPPANASLQTENQT